MKAFAKLLAIVAAVLAAGDFSSQARGATIYGVAVEGATQSLVTWDSAAPGTLLSSVPITGLPAGETIRGIDFDPVNFIAFPGYPRLFAIGAGSDQFANVYRIDALTGGAGKLPPSLSPRADAFGEYYGVTSFGSGAIRSIDDSAVYASYDTTFNSGSGGATVAYAEGDVNAGRDPNLVHLFNSFAVDSTLDVLARIPSSGNPRQVITIAPLGIDIDEAGAIDAALENNTDTIFGAFLPAGQSQSNFYTLNQQTGAAELISPIGTGVFITAMAVEPPRRPIPEPTAAILIIVGLLIPTSLVRRTVQAANPKSIL